jgi:hypothetical protein
MMPDRAICWRVKGERDLNAILSSLAIKRRDGTFVYVSASSVPIANVEATIHEDEGTTVVLERGEAERRGLPWSFAAWLTVEVFTGLEAVGVTAALAAAFADEGISCNVLTGFYHDHLLVPVERADDALAVLDAVRRRASGSR